MQDNMHDMGNITLPSLSIDLRGEKDWSLVSESSSEELSVSSKMSASAGSIVCFEYLVFTPDTSITASNG